MSLEMIGDVGDKFADVFPSGRFSEAGILELVLPRADFDLWGDENVESRGWPDESKLVELVLVGEVFGESRVGALKLCCCTAVVGFLGPALVAEVVGDERDGCRESRGRADVALSGEANCSALLAM